MFSRVLVLTDFSDAARAAERCVRANFPQADVRALHVGLRPSEAERDVEFAPGDPAGVALAHAASGAYDLLALGTSGKNALQRFLLGSVAARVVRESPTPVLTVHADASARPFGRVLVPFDFSPSAERALELARQLKGARVSLLHVIEPGALGGPFALPPARRAEGSGALVERNRLWAAEARVRLAALGGGELVEGDAAACILERAGQHDLIVMGTSGRRGLEGLLFGSVAQRVVRDAAVPVLTVRA